MLMTNTIKCEIGQERRSCSVQGHPAIFHLWMNDGRAIVEFPDRTDYVSATDILFTDEEHVDLVCLDKHLRSLKFPMEAGSDEL